MLLNADELTQTTPRRSLTVTKLKLNVRSNEGRESHDSKRGGGDPSPTRPNERTKPNWTRLAAS